jgi:hypothetical protein
MNDTYQTYRHSGRFAISGPVLALAASAAVGFPLGFVYAYLIRWIPLIYVNFLATLGYGFLFGFLSGWLMRIGRVRSGPVALLTSFLAGVIALYCSWNGHIHATFEGAPIFCLPDMVFAHMQYLYDKGSWALRGDSNLTGIPLAVVWIVEAGMIVGISTVCGYGMIAHTPYCETNQCWLDEERKIDTLESFSDPTALAAFKIGDLSPLLQAKPKPAGASRWTRLTLKHSPKATVFSTVRIQEVRTEVQKDGKLKAKVTDVTGDLMVPPLMVELMRKFEKFGATPADHAELPEIPPVETKG